MAHFLPNSQAPRLAINCRATRGVRPEWRISQAIALSLIHIWWDAAQSPKPGAPGQVKQDGLPVVVGGVGGSDQGGACLLSGPVEKGVTHLTGGLLRPNSHLCGLGRHVAGAGKQGDSGELRAVGQDVYKRQR